MQNKSRETHALFWLGRNEGNGVYADMVIHEIDAAPAPDLQRGLDEFEAMFTVPFAPGRSYRIDYGSDRTAFIRSLGESKCLAAENEGRIVGFLEMALVNLLLPNGATRPAVYIADIKMLPEARATITTARILQKGIEWARARSDLWFTAALDGTPVKPPDYTGRAGIPKFSEAGRLTVVRLPVSAGDGQRETDGRLLARNGEGEELFKQLARGRCGVLGGGAEARSVEPPVWMAHPSGLACGRFEDRRKVRRLIADDGNELRPAYFSCFAFQDAEAAVDLIEAGLRRAESLGFRALRFCLPPGDLAMLQRVVGPVAIHGNGGAVFATAKEETGEIWNLSAAEI